jgi:hypothetical protein
LNCAFETIIQHQLVAWSPVQGDARTTQPLEFGSHKSKLVHVLRDGPCSKRVQLTADEWLTLITWIDANAPYHDQFVNKRQQQKPYSLPDDQTVIKNISPIHRQRCNSCHKIPDVTRPDWIDIHNPSQTLFLASPLAAEAGGSGKCGKTIYKNTNDPDYQKVRQLVETAVTQTWQFPRRDLKALRR